MTKDQAKAKILYAISNRLVMMSVVDREEAMNLAKEFNISALELLEYRLESIRRNT